jgi:predicted RND superfamily exporter protein
MVVNLFETVPGTDQHRGLLGSAFHAFIRSPIGLAFHAVLGTLLVVAALAVSLRAWRARSRKATVTAVFGLVFVLGAWTSGAAFVNEGKDTSSFVMALLTGLAAACYFTTALIAARLEQQPRHSPPH